MNCLIKNKDRNYIELFFLNLVILSYLFRTAIPFLKYPFTLFYVFLIIYSLVAYKKKIHSTIQVFFRTNILAFTQVLLLFVAFIFSNKLFLTVFKDGINAFILLSFIFLMTLIINSKASFIKYLDSLIILIIIFSLLISYNVFGNLFNIFSGSNELSVFGGIQLNPNEVSEKIDNNFGILPVLFGVIVLIYFLIKTNSLFDTVIINILLIVFFASILLSGSRRGFLVFLIIVSAISLIQILRLFIRNPIINKIGAKTLVFLISLFVFTISSIFISSHTSYSFKNKVLESIGCKNLLDTKLKISRILYRLISPIDKTLSFQDIYIKNWTPVFNPNDPESSWGTIYHQSVYPLTGKNVELIPNTAIGYKLNNSIKGSYSIDGDYTDCITSLLDLKVNIGESYKVSVYCYISDDFDWDVVRLTVRTDDIVQKKVIGNPVSILDFNERSTWKKLEIEFECHERQVPIYLSILKNGVKDFSKLKGYVIFAYPNFEKISKVSDDYSQKFNKSILTLYNWKFNANIVTKDNCRSLISSNLFGNEDSSHLQSKNQIPKEIKHEINAFKMNYINNQYKTSSITFGNSLQTISFINLKIISEDPFRNWVSRFFSEDTTFFPCKTKIVIDSITNSFSSPRIVRWHLAIQIFSKEFNWKQKIFGGGFNFLNWYGYYFLKDKTASDWPHNPFLSVLLYSGIIGLLIYFYFMYKVFYYYLKYRKEYPLLFIFFLITFFFSFFSAGSPFDPPIMGFFVILPFFIHSIHKKDLVLKELPDSTDE